MDRRAFFRLAGGAAALFAVGARGQASTPPIAAPTADLVEVWVEEDAASFAFIPSICSDEL